MFRWLILLAGGIIILIIGVFFVWTQLTRASFGPMVALCPGPDFYGYTCENGAAYAYIDATHDTFLYELDGVIQLELPFPFTFYGTPYTELYASVDGNLQFGNNSPEYANTCLDKGPVAGMGDMAAVYWDDLDLRFFGFLETEVVGEAPNRIFVVEWDEVPRYETAEPLTFEIQLFENSQDIVFLYENVMQSEGGNGRKATIGLQSEAQGLALQFSCDLPAVANASQIRFTLGDEANSDVGLAVPPVVADEAAVSPSPRPPAANDPAAQLLHQLNLRGDVALADLHRQWISQSPPVTAVWQRTDLTGDGLPELVVLRHSTFEHPRLSQLIVLTPDPTGHFALLFDQPLATRKQLVYRADIEHEGDLTNDGKADVLLHAPDTGHLFVFTTTFGKPTLLLVPEQCQGSVAVLDLNSDGRDDIVRDGCAGDGEPKAASGRLYTIWSGQGFINQN